MGQQAALLVKGLQPLGPRNMPISPANKNKLTMTVFFTKLKLTKQAREQEERTISPMYGKKAPNHSIQQQLQGSRNHIQHIPSAFDCRPLGDKDPWRSVSISQDITRALACMPHGGRSRAHAHAHRRHTNFKSSFSKTAGW